jgi:hypothetical protein
MNAEVLETGNKRKNLCNFGLGLIDAVTAEIIFDWFEIGVFKDE